MAELISQLPHRARLPVQPVRETVSAQNVPLMERTAKEIWTALATYNHPQLAELKALEDEVKQVAGESAVYAWPMVVSVFKEAIQVAGARWPFVDVMAGNGTMLHNCAPLGIRRLFNVDSAIPPGVPRNPQVVAQEYAVNPDIRMGMVCSRALTALASLQTGSMNVCINGVYLGGGTPVQQKFAEALGREMARVVPTGGVLIGQGRGVDEIRKLRPHHFTTISDTSGNAVLRRTALAFDQDAPAPEAPPPAGKRDTFERTDA